MARRAAWVLVLGLTMPGLVTAEGDAGGHPPVARPATVWLQPLPTVVAATSGDLHLSGGGSWWLADWEWLMHGYYLRGNQYGCLTRSEGAGVSVGLGRPLWEHRGWFWQARIAYRWFTTEGGTSGFFCSADTAASLEGEDWELGLVGDFGYAFDLDWFYLAPVVGLGAAWCQNCPSGGPFFFGSPRIGGMEPRRSRPTLLINANLVRVGLRF